MMNTTRKRFWPLSLAATLAVIGVLAVAVALTALPGATFAQDPPAPPPLPGASPTPTGTPADPNAPPAPPALPATATPTATAEPTPTPTEEPTETPAPTEEPTETPAPTEEPTETPAPTEEPTETPAPTEEPTETPPTPDPNQPTKVGEIDNQELEGGEESLTFNVSEYFTVAAEDVTLTYTAESSDENIATVSISGSLLTITRATRANAEGTVSIMVWAHNDELGLRSEPQTFSAVVPIRSADLYDIRAASSDPDEGVTRKGKVNGIETIYVIPTSRVERLHEFVVTASDKLTEDVTITVFVKESNFVTGESRRGELYIGAVNLLTTTDDIEYQDGEYQKGSLTVRATDEGSERDFAIRSKCERVGDRIDIVIRDNELVEVGRAIILCAVEPPPAPDPTITVTGAGCYQIISGRDAQHDGMVWDEWRDDARDAVTSLRTTSAGRYTIEVLEGRSDIQVTVTACEEGPVYIRFLDADGNPFGADVDESGQAAGADLVGLDSQRRLELNLGRTTMSAAQAHWYDHFTVTTTTTFDGVATEELTGNPGAYYQGKFRLFNPCTTPGGPFTIQVYEKRGKVFQTEEQVSCVPIPTLALGAPSNLSATAAAVPGTVVLNWTSGANAAMHWIAGVKQSDRDAGDYSGVIWMRARSNTAHTVTGLDSGAEYVFTVAAGRGAGSSEEWSGWAALTSVTPN